MAIDNQKLSHRCKDKTILVSGHYWTFLRYWNFSCFLNFSPTFAFEFVWFVKMEDMKNQKNFSLSKIKFCKTNFWGSKIRSKPMTSLFTSAILSIAFLFSQRFYYHQKAKDHHWPNNNIYPKVQNFVIYAGAKKRQWTVVLNTASCRGKNYHSRRYCWPGFMFRYIPSTPPPNRRDS